MPVRKPSGPFISAIARLTAAKGREYARPATERASKTLSDAMQVLSGPEVGEARIFIPHYWAEFVHDGRGAPLSPKPPTRAFVWFTNPKEDPRLVDGKTPERVSQLRRLQLPKGEFRSLFETGRLKVRKVITKPTSAKLFFDNSAGMAGFGDVASKFIQSQFSPFVVLGLTAEKVLRITGSCVIR